MNNPETTQKEFMVDQIEGARHSMDGKIFKAIPAIMAAMEPVAKEQRNREQNYAFRGIDDIYNALQRLMAKHEVFSTTRIVSESWTEIVSKGGSKGTHAVIKYTFRFFCGDGSYVDTDAFGEGIDYGDKTANKCASIAHKYAMIQTYCIPTKPSSTTPPVKPNSGQADGPKPRDLRAPASEKQRKLIWAKLKGELQYPDDFAKAFITEHTGKFSSKELTLGDIEQLLNKIEEAKANAGSNGTGDMPSDVDDSSWSNNQQ